MTRPLALVIVLLALAIVLALGLQQCAPQAPSDVAPPPETVHEPASPPERSSPAAAVVDDRTTAETPTRTPANAGSAHADAAQGVFGRVVDARGQPLAGVEALLLEATSNDPLRRFMARAHGVPTLASASALTEADGRFRLGIRQQDELQYEVCVRATGFAYVRLGELRVPAGEWLDLGDVTLLAGATIRGRVTVAGTELPAPGATVRIESGNPFFDLGPAQLPGWRERNVTTVDHDGVYELRDVPRRGAFRLLAAAPGFGRQIRDQIEPGEGTLQVDFALPRGMSIGGVFDTGGAPLGAVRIECYSKATEPAFHGSTATDGRFFVHGLREGPHLLRIEADGYQPVSIDNVAAGTDDLRVVLSPRGSASVEVHDPDGTLLRQYRVAVRRYLTEHGGALGTVRDVADRVVRLDAGERAVTIEGLDPGDYVFQVEAPGFASTLSDPFQLSQEKREAAVTMTVVRGGSLGGRVVDLAGAPIADATVTTQPDGAIDDNPVIRMLASLTPDRITRASATTDADGRFVLRGLAYAPYQLQVVHPQYCRTTRGGIEMRADELVEVPPITLARGTAVRGRALVDGVPTGHVVVVLTQDPSVGPGAGGPESGPPEKSRDETTVVRVEAVTNTDGSFELPRRVPPGAYELRGVIQLGLEPNADPFQKLMQLKKSAVRVTVLPGQEVAVVDLRLTSDH